MADQSALSRQVVWAYALPALPLAVLTIPYYVILPAYYIESFGVSAAMMGFALIALRLFDGITDPVAGFFSDITRTRFGRRKPWIFVGTPLVMLGVFMLFSPPPDADGTHFVVWSCVMTAGWTMVIVPYAAWGAELSDLYHERTRIVGAREAAILLGTLLAILLPETVKAISGSEATGVSAIAWAVGFTLPLLIWLCLSRVPDRLPIKRDDRHGLAAGAGGGWRLIAANKHFRRLIVAYLVNGLANGLPGSLFILFVTHALHAPDLAGPLLLAYFLAGLLSVPVWMRLSRRWEKHHAWCRAMMFSCSVFILTPVAVWLGDPMIFAVICTLSGLALGADLSLPASIQADVIDADTAAGGGERAGLYFALWGIASKFAGALSAGPALIAIGFLGFDAELPRQSDTVIIALTALYSVIPVILKVGAIRLMWNFTLGYEEQHRLRAAIATAKA